MREEPSSEERKKVAFAVNLSTVHMALCLLTNHHDEGNTTFKLPDPHRGVLVSFINWMKSNVVIIEDGVAYGRASYINQVYDEKDAFPRITITEIDRVFLDILETDLRKHADSIVSSISKFTGKMPTSLITYLKDTITGIGPYCAEQCKDRDIANALIEICESIGNYLSGTNNIYPTEDTNIMKEIVERVKRDYPL